VTDDDEERALVPPEAPRFELAPTLASARRNELVYVDKKGQVRSPTRFRIRQAVSYGLVGALGVGTPLFYGSLFGPIGLAGGLVVTALLGRGIRRGLQLRRAVVLSLHDREDEAMPVFEKIARSWAPARLRAIAEQNLAACHVKRGDHAEALVHYRRAIELHPSRNPLAVAARYGEILSLVNIDRVQDAAALFVEVFPRPPEGDYLRVQHWVVELYLAMAGVEITLDAEDLHERARVALGMTTGAALLALLAWAHHRGGDLDQAWHLLREALDRDHARIQRALPKLQAWMDAHAAEARAAAPEDDGYG
jgi:tetratricopeptide (TPR) repeat protein